MEKEAFMSLPNIELTQLFSNVGKALRRISLRDSQIMKWLTFYHLKER